SESQAAMRVRLQKELRTNTYRSGTKTLVVSDLRARAIAATGKHYESLFMADPKFAKLRDAYAIPENSIADPDRMKALNHFFFWASWACVTERPGSSITYTNNWPPDELVGNRPPNPLVLWTGFSVILLIAGIGALAFHRAFQKNDAM